MRKKPRTNKTKNEAQPVIKLAQVDYINLIKNAIEAIDNKSNGSIEICAYKSTNNKMATNAESVSLLP